MDYVKEWELYQAGKKFNNQLKLINDAGYYDLCNALVDFVNGNQWRNLEVSGMRKPVFNLMNKALRFWVASITANNTKIDLEPLRYSHLQENEEMDIADFAAAEIENLFEKFKIDNRIREALFKSGTVGDVAAHMYFDPGKKPYGGAFHDIEGEIEFELISGTNVFFGNANNPDKEIQPYIILEGRELVKTLKDEVKGYQADGIEEDGEFDSDLIEVEADGYGKATYIIVYKKKKVKDKKERVIEVPAIDEEGYPIFDEFGEPLMMEAIEEYEEERETILVTKCVKNAYIYKDVDTGLSHYPISWLTWDRQENQYHGKMPLAEAMETQIFINLMFAMIMYHLTMTAFPKAIYDKDKVKNWSNRVAEAIPVERLEGESIRNVAGYLEPATMSPQIVQAIDMAYGMTKDLLGISEAALGEINPENASGKAILATVEQSAIPLENTKAHMYEWIEDIGIVLLDMMGTYYGTRPIVVEREGEKEIVNFDFEDLKNIFLNVKVDVGTTNVWSDQARKQTLDNLFVAGAIDIIQYLERLDDSDVKDRQGLIEDIRQQIEQQQNMQPGELNQIMQQPEMYEELPFDQIYSEEMMI